MGRKANSWDRVAKQWKQISGEDLTGARCGQIAREAETIIAGPLAEIALQLGIINESEAECYRQAAEACLQRRACKNAGERLGEGNPVSIQLLLPWESGVSSDHACSD